MNTKYGQLPDESLFAYVEGMTAKLFKLIPMKQYGTKTLPLYIEGTIREFIGEKELVEEFKNSSEFLTILGVMESLLDQDDFMTFRSDVFKIINLVNRLKSTLGGDK